jgi:hypothetical protein
MTIARPDVVEKTALRTLSTAAANKVTAEDVNEIVRAIDDIIDVVSDRAPLAYGGLYICEGVGTQTLSSETTTTLSQWTNAQPQEMFTAANGDQVLTVPVGGAGRYRASIEHFVYTTDAKNREVFRIRILKNGAVVPGLCSRVEHSHNTDSSYHATIGLVVDLAEGDVLSVAITTGVLASPRTLGLRHASIVAHRIGG